MADQILVEYKVALDGLKADFATIKSEFKSVEQKGKESAENTSKQFTAAGQTIKGIATEIATSLGIAFSVAKVIDFGDKAIKAFREAEEVAKKLEFAITKIGKEGVSAFEKLNKQADQFAKKSIFDDESIRKSQTQLAQYGLQSDAIEELIPKIIDLASATGQDLGQATDIAIQGINGQSRALKPYGILLDDTGDKTKNLNILLDGLSKFAGSAGDALETSAGQAKLFDNEINEIEESIGQKLAPTFDKVKLIFLNGLDQEIEKIQEFSENWTNLFGSEDDKFKMRLKQFENLSAESQTKISFDLAKKGAERTDLEQKLFVEYRKIIEARLNGEEKAEKKSLGLTQKGVDDKAAAIKKQEEARIKQVDFLSDLANKTEEDLRQEEENTFKMTEDREKRESDAHEDFLKDKAKADAEYYKNRQEQTDENSAYELKLEKEQLDAFKQMRQEYINGVSDLVNGFIQYQQELDDRQQQKEQDQYQEKEDASAERRDKEIENLQHQLDENLISEEDFKTKKTLIDAQYDIQKKQLDQAYEQSQKEAQRRAAIRQKAAAAFNIALATAQGVVEALAIPPPAGEALAIERAIFGAAQLALALAAPLPFAKGTERVKGGTKGVDSVHALLMPDEAVIRANENMAYPGLAKSWNEGKLEEYILSNFINPRLSEYVKKDKSTADNMAESIKINFPDEHAMGRVMRRNNNVRIENVDYLAKAIAKEIKPDKRRFLND